MYCVYVYLYIAYFIFLINYFKYWRKLIFENIIKILSIIITIIIIASAILSEAQMSSLSLCANIKLQDTERFCLRQRRAVWFGFQILLVFSQLKFNSITELEPIRLKVIIKIVEQRDIIGPATYQQTYIHIYFFKNFETSLSTRLIFVFLRSTLQGLYNSEQEMPKNSVELFILDCQVNFSQQCRSLWCQNAEFSTLPEKNIVQRKINRNLLYNEHTVTREPLC